MLDAPAVLFTITIPTAVEEQRLKKLFMRQLNEDGTTTTTATAGTRSTLSVATDEHSVSRSHHQAADSLYGQPPHSNLIYSNQRLQTQLTDAVEKTEFMDMPLDTAMELVLQQILRKFQISNAMWLLNQSGNSYQISFTVEFNELYEDLYDVLQQWGIGDREGSSMSVMNCIVSKSSNTNNRTQSDKQPQGDVNSDSNNNAQKHGAWDRFMNSMRSRLNVAKIVRDVRQDAAITFDFCILLVSAAILASFGLVENSTIFLASSMLISPLMGPIIASIFGTVIDERSLRRLGVQNELIGILLATLVGFLFGLAVCSLDKNFSIGEGLTEEMLSRCDLHSLVVGLFTAIPSGAAAAIGILGGNIGSLVGVAISASLLPPAVNSGLLWALACMYKLYEHDDSLYVNVIKSRKYFENQAAELAVLGSISMCLTLSNVVCIYVMGILVLKVKQIAPVIGRSNRQFWMHDIKLSRGDAAIIDELLSKLDTEDKRVINENFLRHLDESAYQHTWSPRSMRHSFSKQVPGSGFSTIHRLEQLYSQSLSKPFEETPKCSIERRHTHIMTKPSHLGINHNTKRRHTQCPINITKTRPRCENMPAHEKRQKQDSPQTVVNMTRFTVTPADENMLQK